MTVPCMPTGNGTFCWNQLNTPDLEASKAFYGGLLGWTFPTDDQGGHAWNLIMAGDRVVGDLQAMPAGLKAPSHWLSYVRVPDLDAAVALAESRGSTLYVRNLALPGVGRIAVFADPQGAMLGLFTGEETHPEEPQPIVAGSFCWYECLTRNLDAELSFYADLLGWTTTPQPMPGGFTYHLQLRGTDQVAGLMGMEGDGWDCIPDHWSGYIAVADLDATAAKVGSLGGAILVPPTDIPVGRFAVIRDAVGATVSLFQGA